MAEAKEAGQTAAAEKAGARVAEVTGREQTAAAARVVTLVAAGCGMPTAQQGKDMRASCPDR